MKAQQITRVQGRSGGGRRRLRFAIIGCGDISRMHGDALASMPEVELVAAVDLNPDRLQGMKRTYGIKGLYGDMRTMLRESRPDAVSVCTPNGQHAATCMAASRAGCDVITEKPMAMNPGECRQMLAAARKAGRLLAVGFQYRFHPVTQMLKRFHGEGRFGKLMLVKCQALRRRGIPNWGVFGRKELQGGGPLMDIGVHVIEMAHYVMGCPRPVAATGKTWRFMGDKRSDVVSLWPGWDWQSYTVEDLAVGLIRFDNGAVLQIEASFCGHIEKDLLNFTLMGEKAGATWDPAALFTDDAGTMVNITPAWLPAADFAFLFKAKLQNFVDACLKGTPLEAPGEDGLAVQGMIDGVYRSAAVDKEVRL